jgi:glycosyltransferase involved in cell wall biosynthesis
MYLNGFTIHFKQGGGEKALYNLLRQKNNNYFKIFCFKHTDNIYLENVEIISLQKEGLIKFFVNLYQCKHVNIISSLWSSNLILIIFKQLGLINNIWIREGNEVTSAIKDSSFFKGLLWKNCIKYFYKYSNKIIVMNDCMGISLLKLNKNLEKKIKIVPNYIDLNHILHLSRQKLNKDLLFFKDIEFILTIGRLCNQKNYFKLIDAYYISKNKFGIKAKLVIIGSGELKQKIFSKINKLNLSQDIILIDFIENPYNIINLSKLYIMNSFYEGYPNALVEAIILTKNVVSSNCNCGPRDFLTGEHKKRLFNPHDVNDISSKIVNFIDSKKMKIDAIKRKINEDNLKILQ